MMLTGQLRSPTAAWSQVPPGLSSFCRVVMSPSEMTQDRSDALMLLHICRRASSFCLCLRPAAWRVTPSVLRRFLFLTPPSATSLRSTATATPPCPAPATPTAPPPSAGPREPRTRRYGSSNLSCHLLKARPSEQGITGRLIHAVAMETLR